VGEQVPAGVKAIVAVCAMLAVASLVDSRIFAIAREGLQIIARVLIVFYLTQEPVKEWFALR